MLSGCISIDVTVGFLIWTGVRFVSIHDFDGIKRILGLPITSRRGYANDLPILEAGRRAGSATIYLDPTGEFPWQDRADLPITTLAEITAMLENCQ